MSMTIRVPCYDYGDDISSDEKEVCFDTVNANRKVEISFKNEQGNICVTFIELDDFRRVAKAIDNYMGL